jgi:hypothetical protein
MSDLVNISLIFVAGGALLAILMFLTAARVEKLAESTGQPLEVTVGNFSLKTSNVLVALGVVSFATMVGVPSYFLYLNAKIDDRQMSLTFQLKPPTGQPLQVTRDDRCVIRSAFLQLYKTRDPQVFTVTDAPFDPVNVRVKYEWSSHRPIASINGGPDIPIKDFDGASGTLPTIELTRQTIPPKLDGGSNLTKPASTAANLKNVADPPPVANNATAVSTAGSL